MPTFFRKSLAFLVERVSERISSSYSGLPFGHYNAVSFDYNLSALHAEKLSACTKKSIPPMIWGQGLAQSPFPPAALSKTNSVVLSFDMMRFGLTGCRCLALYTPVTYAMAPVALLLRR